MTNHSLSSDISSACELVPEQGTWFVTSHGTALPVLPGASIFPRRYPIKFTPQFNNAFCKHQLALPPSRLRVQMWWELEGQALHAKWRDEAETAYARALENHRQQVEQIQAVNQPIERANEAMRQQNQAALAAYERAKEHFSLRDPDEVAEEINERMKKYIASEMPKIRDRALIGVMTATFGRVEATLGMNVADYFPEGKHWSIRLNEKNSKVITMPVQHKLEKYLDEYIEAMGGPDAFPLETSPAGKTSKNRPLFLSSRGRSKTLGGRRMTRQDAWRMVKRRAKAAGIITTIGNHSFRGTGITNYLENGGSLSEAQRMAGHADPRTTRLYDRRDQKITRGEVERITILG
jgi:site-specific recombinase XerD